jgi:PAS domain S-box-containing protein
VSLPPPPEGPPPPRATVLVASSDSATRDLLRRVLDVPAVEVVDASDGVEALALARRLDLDLVVLDAFLAVMDGLSVCARIRALTGLDQPPILVLGLSSERSIEVALTSGADETLAKPLNPALLRYRVRVLLVRRQEERRLRLLQRAVEAAPFGMALLDARSSEYDVAFANPAFLRQTGYGPGEIVGKNLRLLAGPATGVAAMTDLRQAMAEGRPTRVLLRSYRKDGQAFWNDLAAAPVVDAAGRLTHYVSVQSDVTALLEAPEREAARTVDEAVAARTAEVEAALARVEERRRFTETILNALVSGILATDAKGAVTFANLAALRALGTSLHDCIGRSVVELFGHHEGVAEVIAGSVHAHPEHRLDFPLISPGGTRFYVGMSITPAPAAFRNEVAFIFIFRDLAETIDIETDPKLKLLTVAQDEADARLSPVLAEAAAEPEAKRRVLLALRYTAPADLARAAIQALSGPHQPDGEFVRLETADDVPEVLLDRQQVTEALTMLLASALEACPNPADVRVRLSRVEATDGPSAQPVPAARIEIAYPAVITDRDLGTDPGGTARRPQRRMDLATAEKLLEANGGRLIRPPRDAAGGPVLAVLLRAAR